jgi:hypothetical protein
VEEIFVVAFHAGDGGVDDIEVDGSQDGGAVVELVDGFLAGLGVADDSSLADVLAAYLKLGLDEDDGGSLPGVVGCAEGADDGGEDESGGDEGDVHCEEGWGRGVRREEFAGGEETSVGSLAQGNAGVGAEFLGDLAVTGVDGEDGGGSGLEHAVGEAAGGGSYVDAGEAGEVEMPVLKGVLELEAAAAYVFEVGAEEADDCVGWDGGAGLVDALLVDEDAASEDEGLSTFAGGGVALVYEEFVEAGFHETRSRRQGSGSRVRCILLVRVHDRGERMTE